MPHRVDYNKLENVKTIECHPNGWVTPLYIEYGIHNNVLEENTPMYYWRVKGTEHTFIIPVVRLDFISSGDYAKHFAESLEMFREDYIEWAESNFFTSWMQEYEKEYSKFIVL